MTYLKWMWSFPLFPRQASVDAQRTDMVFFGLLIICGFVAVTTAVMIWYFAIKYHRDNKVHRSKYTPHAGKIEMAMLGVPAVIFTVIFLWASAFYVRTEVPPANTLDIQVVGKQWMWKMQYPGGQREINTLYVPVNQPVRLILTSQDVIHDFSIPVLRVKQDVLPGRFTTEWFKPNIKGRFHIFCDQYCGSGHSSMVGTLVVLDPKEYLAWLGPGSPLPTVAGTPGTPGAPLRRGEGTFFQLGCNACHVVGSAQRAPRLEGIFGKEVALRNGQKVLCDEEYIRESILDPNAKISAGYASPSLMPSYRGQISDQQIYDLIEYIKSLSPDTPEGLHREYEPQYPRGFQQP